MPWLVEVKGCTGFIIGKKHFLTAIHCYDTDEKMKRREWVYIGLHYMKVPKKPFIGKRVQINTKGVFGINMLGVSVIPFPDAESHVPDIALVTLVKEIQFGKRINKAILDSPSSFGDDCRMCTGICQISSGHYFQATGFGLYQFRKISKLHTY